MTWFNDTWMFDARSNSWAQVDPSGTIPTGREGHAAALVLDTIFIFGGRGSDRKDLSDLCAFRIPARRWYRFGTMPKAPTGRSGHRLSTHEDSVILLGGETQSVGLIKTDQTTMAYILDTARIKFTKDAHSGSTVRSPTQREIDDQRSNAKPQKKELKGKSSKQSMASANHMQYGSPLLAASRDGFAGEDPSSLERAISPHSPVFVTYPDSQKANHASPAAGSSMSPNLKSPLQEQEDLSRSVNDADVPNPNITQSTENTLAPAASHQMSYAGDEGLRAKLAWATAELALAHQNGYKVASENVENMAVLSKVVSRTSKDRALIEALVATGQELSHLKSQFELSSKQSTERIAEAEKQREEAVLEAAYARAHMAASVDDDTRQVEGNRVINMQRKLTASLSLQNSISSKYDDLQSRHIKEQALREQLQRDSGSREAQLLASERGRRNSEREIEDLKTRVSAIRTNEADSAPFSKYNEALKENEKLSKLLAQLKETAAHQQAALEAARAAVVAVAARAELHEQRTLEERNAREEESKDLAPLKGKLNELSAERDTLVRKVDAMTRDVDIARKEADSSRNVMLSGLERLLSTTSVTATVDNVEPDINLQKELQEHREQRSLLQGKLDKHMQELEVNRSRTKEYEESTSQIRSDFEQLQLKYDTLLSELDSVKADRTEQHNLLDTKIREMETLTLKHATLRQLLGGRSASISTPTDQKRNSIGQVRAVGDAHPGSPVDTPRYQARLYELEAKLDESVKLQDEMEQARRRIQEDLAATSQKHEEAVKRQLDAEYRSRMLEEQLASSSVATEDISTQQETLEAQRRAADAERSLANATDGFKNRLSQLETDYHSAIHYVQGSDKVLGKFKAELTRFKTQNVSLQQEVRDLRRASRDSVPSIANSKFSHDDLSQRIRSPESSHSHIESRLQQPRTHSKKPSTQSNSSMESRRPQQQIGNEKHDEAASRSLLQEKSKSNGLALEHTVDSAAPRPQQAAGVFDSLADELDQLRSQWEHTHNYADDLGSDEMNEYRSSPDFFRNPTTQGLGLSSADVDYFRGNDPSPHTQIPSQGHHQQRLQSPVYGDWHKGSSEMAEQPIK